MGLSLAHGFQIQKPPSLDYPFPLPLVICPNFLGLQRLFGHLAGSLVFDLFPCLCSFSIYAPFVLIWLVFGNDRSRALHYLYRCIVCIFFFGLYSFWGYLFFFRFHVLAFYPRHSSKKGFCCFLKVLGDLSIIRGLGT